MAACGLVGSSMGFFLALVDIRTVAVCFTIAGTEGLEGTL